MRRKVEAQQRRGPERIARGISLALTAPTVAALAFVWIFVALESAAPSVLLVSLTFGTACPLALVVGLARVRILPDIYASDLVSRRIAFSGATAGYVIGWGALESLHAPLLITGLMLCYAGNTAALLALSLRWKLSVHASGVTGPATWITLGVGVPGLALLGLLGPVAWARLRLHAHTPGEVVAAAALTIPLTLAQFAVYVGLRPGL